MSGSGDVYTHGHHESVLRSHRWRTAQNSAGYLLGHLRPDMRLLDVGCGPGTITADFARLLPDGDVVGIEPDAAALAAAGASTALEAAGASIVPGNLEFEVADVYQLPYADGSFDVVHAHQVLQHLTDPVAALREMGRVCAPGGLVAARDGDYAGFFWAPANPGLDRWADLYQRIARANGAEPNAGRYLFGWAQAAGFDVVVPSASIWCYADEDTRAWWGESWADRATRSRFAEQAETEGHASAAELAEIAQAWQAWAAAPDGWLAIPHGEILCRVP